MRYFTPIILITASIGLYFTLISSSYEKVKEVSKQNDELNKVLSNFGKILSLRDELVQEYNVIPDAQFDKVRKIIPEEIDDSRLILEVLALASRHGLSVQEISLSEDEVLSKLPQATKSVDDVNSININLSVAGFYPNLRAFLVSLEQNLRIMDVIDLTFSEGDSGFTTYGMKIKTYWMK